VIEGDVTAGDVSTGVVVITGVVSAGVVVAVGFVVGNVSLTGDTSMALVLEEELADVSVVGLGDVSTDEVW